MASLQDLAGLVAAPLPAQEVRERRLEPGLCDLCGHPCSTWAQDAQGQTWRMHGRCWMVSTSVGRDRGRALNERTGAPPEAPAASPPSPVVVGSRQPGALALVVDGSGTGYLSTGEQLPVGTVGSLLQLVELGRDLGLRGAVAGHQHAEPGQLWLTTQAAAQVGVPIGQIEQTPMPERTERIWALTEGLPGLDDVVDAGWQVARLRLGRWTRFWQPGEPGLHVVLASALDPSETALVAGDPAPARLAGRVGRLHELLGFPFRAGAGVTALDLAMSLRGPRGRRMFAPYAPVEPARIATVEGDQTWSRAPREDEGGWLHYWDRSGSQLGVLGTDFGVGEPTHYPEGLPPGDLDRMLRLPGYALVEVPEPSDWRRPPVLDPFGRSAPGSTRWVTTTALALARSLDEDPAVREAWVWHDHARVFEPLYRRLRDARKALDPADPEEQVLQTQIKLMYTRMIGLLGSVTYRENRPGFAPERRHLIVGTARVNLLRRIVKVGAASGRWPLVVHTDMVGYASEEPDPWRAWPGAPGDLGTGLGQLHPYLSVPVDQQRQWLGKGPGYQGLREAVEWAEAHGTRWS